jgi:hypothetical protein
VSRDTTNEPVVLFDPADAVRSVSRGVFVDYYLKTPSGPVTIEFLDPQGQSIRTFTGSPEAEGRGAPAETTGGGGRGGRGGGAPARLTATAGMNRFTWDMRYPNAKDFPGMILWSGSTRGPQAPPGRYTVKLTAGGVTRAQEFVIRRNEAVASVTDADLLAQFTLARQISEKVSAANEAVIRIREIKTQIADKIAKASDPTIAAAGQALTEKFTEVEGEIYQHRNRSNQDPLNYPIRLNNKLAALQGVVESGDAKPTDQSYAVFKDLSARLDAQLARLDALVKGELAAFMRGPVPVSAPSPTIESLRVP